MLKIKSVTMRNFMSVGAVTQSVDLTKNGVTLVFGENLDLGGNGSRNGVGKSTINDSVIADLENLVDYVKHGADKERI